MDHYFDLGPYHRPITTHSAEAQVWFDRGLNWCYAFHREEALRCFANVIELDPDCAMGCWAIAYATGPYDNSPWPKFSKKMLPAVIKNANLNVLEAQKRAGNAAPVEQALIRALIRRFPDPVCADGALCSQWDDGYAERRRLGHDDEAVVIEQQLAAAQAFADVPVTVSCFCRQPDSCCDLGG